MRFPGCLTFAGLPVNCGDEAHVAFAAVASRQIQAVAIVTQVAVLSAFVAVCGHTVTCSQRPSQAKLSTCASVLNACVT